jgi:non-canonical poly(A) RNA polymerase PAPD5/7
MPPSRDFDFRHEAPLSIRDRIRQPERGRDLNLPDRRNRTSRYRRSGRRNQLGEPRRVAPGAHERPLMYSARERTPEQLFGMHQDGAEKFMGMADLSESEEDMDLETGSSAEELELSKADSFPSKGIKAVDPPKWSNPDPYTVLPPVTDESRAKKRDVVKLIRKARITATRPNMVEDSVTVNNDFISLSFGDDSNEPYIPTGPKALLQKPAPSASTAPASSGTNGDSKKRKRDDVEDLSPPPHLMKKAKRFNVKSKGEILEEWKATEAMDQVPWSDRDHSETLSMGFWLVFELEVSYTILTIF